MKDFLIFQFQGLANGGGFKRGCSPIRTCPSFLILSRPFWVFPDFFGIFPILSGIKKGSQVWKPSGFPSLKRSEFSNENQKLKKAVAVSEEKIQERSKNLGGADCPAAICHVPCRKVPKPRQGYNFAAGKRGKNFPAASKEKVSDELL